MRTRHVRLTLLLAQLAPTLTCGCDSEFTLIGTVEDLDGHAVPSADVQIDCDDGAFDRTRADQTGRFMSHRLGWCPGNCSVVVKAEGFVAYRAPILKHCRKKPWHIRNACLNVRLDARLLRQQHDDR